MSADGPVKYTVFIKAPFPRAGFEDPPDPDWNPAKDRELWKTLSSTARGKDIDWEALAQRFDVSMQFLLQQAAWLYEKQLSQVREQLRKVAKNPSGASPTPGSASGTTNTPTGGYSMKRGGSQGSRVPSSLSVRQRASLDFQGEGSVPSTPVQSRVPYSRTASKDTITQLPQGTGESPRPARTSLESRMRETQILSRNRSNPTSPSADDSSSNSSSSSSPAPPVSQSRAFARRPNFGSPKSKGKVPLAMLSSGDEDEEDDSPAFLPYSEPKDAQRSDSKARGKQPVRPQEKDPANPSTSSSQSLPSPAPQSSSVHSIPSPASNQARPSAAAALSPRQRRLAQDGSEGTPSMGSSFSDLDEASLTQSALEEALAREMRAGKGSLGVVSRVGGLWKGQGRGAGRPT